MPVEIIIQENTEIVKTSTEIEIIEVPTEIVVEQIVERQG